MNRQIIKVSIVFFVVGSMVWVGYSSRKAATRVRTDGRTYEPTAARMEGGRYLVFFESVPGMKNATLSSGVSERVRLTTHCCFLVD